MIGGTLTYGEFFLFYQLLLQLVWPLEALGWILSLAQRATASASRSFAWLQGSSRSPSPSQPTRCPRAGSPSRFEGVHFSYGTGSEVLSGVDLALEPGEVIAVCGPTGAGKTSLLNLLPRFYDPTEGRVLVGGVDVRDLPLAELRAAVAIVTQKPILFSIPLRDNLTAARPDAPWDEVVAACEAAGVAQFAAELPDGYDTLIGERGVNLSGGQRQRVALARALVAGARVVVLDDPMSAVDTQTERHLVENLRPALAGRTVLIATQRLSTVEVADRAVVLDDGVDRRVGHAAGAARRRRPLRRRSSERKSVPRLRQRTGPDPPRPLPRRPPPARRGARARRRLLGRGPRRARCSSCRTRSTRACAPTTSGRLTRDVVVYLVINALAWVLQTTLVRGLAARRPGRRARPARRPLRPPDDAVAALLLAAEGRLDHRAAHVRRRRALRRPLAGADDARRQHADAARGDLSASSSSTGASALVALVILPPTLVLTRWFQVRSHAAFLRVRETISSLTAQIAESVSGMAVIQAFNRERAFLAEFDAANDANRRTNTHAQCLNSLFFPGIEFLGIVAMASVLWVGGRMLDGRHR